jgi:hypothetical protein
LDSWSVMCRTVIGSSERGFFEFIIIA